MSRIEDRQKALVDWLRANHKLGEFHSVKEVCYSVVDEYGCHYYDYNDTNPYNHDKCAVLSNDVRTLNWSCDNGAEIIIKDKKGGIKLCESMEEFEDWRKTELEPLDRKWKYLNNLKYKAKLDGQCQLPL